jgi:DNA anti-recombination protein RmuC
MGFRTLALEKQASEVWKVLGAVKTEFDRYGEWVAKVREQVQKAADTLDLLLVTETTTLSAGKIRVFAVLCDIVDRRENLGLSVDRDQLA